MNEGGDAYALVMEQLMAKYSKEAREKYMVRALEAPVSSLLQSTGSEGIRFETLLLCSHDEFSLTSRIFL